MRQYVCSASSVSSVSANFFGAKPEAGWQALFAARIVGDIVGRFLPSNPSLRSRGALLAFALLKTAMTGPAFLYLHKVPCPSPPSPTALLL